MGLIDPDTIARSGTEHAIQAAFFQWAALNSQNDPG